MKTILLEHAKAFAAIAIGKLAGLVQRVEIAGSARREKPTVGNIDLVLVPKPDPNIEGRTIPFFTRDTLTRLVKGSGSPERIIHFAGLIYRPVPHESTERFFVLETIMEKRLMLPEGLRIQVAIATPENFGHVMLYRTGSRAFNEYLARRAESRGLLWSPFANRLGAAVPEGLFDPSSDQVVACKDEADFFKALNLDYVEPKDRERVK